MSKKKIARIMPKSMNPIGKKLATIHCRNLGFQDGTPEFQEEFDSYMFDFYDEAYGLSMTPSGLIGQNPATPKVKEEDFRELKKIFGENGLIANLKRNEYEKTNFDRILRGNISSIAHFILDAKFGLKIKGKNNSPSDFEYIKGSDDKDTKVEERNAQVTLNRYLRLYLIIKLTKELEGILSSEEDLNEYTILDEVFGDKWRKDSQKFLNDKANRKFFVQKIYGQDIKKSNPVKKENPVMGKEYTNEFTSKTSSYYFVESVGLYFDKEKVDDLVEKAIKEGNVQPCPIKFKNEEEKNDFRKNLKINLQMSHQDIMKADMTLPVLFGTRKKNGVVDNFVILGRHQMLKVMELGLPSVDCIVLDQEETLKLIDTKKQANLKNIRNLNS